MKTEHGLRIYSDGVLCRGVGSNGSHGMGEMEEASRLLYLRSPRAPGVCVLNLAKKWDPSLEEPNVRSCSSFLLT